MAEKISINLLPAEFLVEEIKKSKFYKVQAIGIGVVLVLIFLSVVTVSLRILQSNRIKSTEVEVANAENRVTSFSSKQAQLILLKNRLEAINTHLGTSSKTVEMYNLLDSLIPPSISIGTISVGAEGKVLVSASTEDFGSIDNMFSDMLNVEKNEGKVSKVLVDNISRGRDGTYRLSFTVVAQL